MRSCTSFVPAFDKESSHSRVQDFCGEQPLNSTAALLEAKHLGRKTSSKILVEDANFALRPGEVLAIAGPSGAGKSSLLRLLNRLDEPTSGTVYLEGEDYRHIPARDVRRRVGMVTQRPYLFPGTVSANLNFGPQQRGETLKPEAVNELLDQVALGGFADRDVANLSGGEAQRVSLARTLANSPEVLLLDEPTASLDEASKCDVEALLLRIVHERWLTCVIVTHDVAQAGRIAPRILIMNAGRIVRDGPTAEVLHA
jgi:putative ABC transport system ATP-binding protein